MTAANNPLAWQNFYIMIGSANAAITGLVFVALSIHLSEILRHPVFKPRAVVVLIVLTSQIIICAIILSPQPIQWMGGEIVLLNLFFIALNLRYRARTEGRPTLTAGITLTLLIRVTYLWAALSLVIGVGGGLYLLGVILLITLARSMANCWTLLTALESIPSE